MEEVQNESIEVVTSIIPTMRFKITNVKNNNKYPAILDKTDYFDLVVGDIVSMGYNMNTLYKINKIERDLVTDPALINKWKSHICPKVFVKATQITTETIRDAKANTLLKEYQDNLNFGYNKIHLEAVLRSGKKAVRSRFTTVWEFDYIKYVNYNYLNKVNMVNIIVANNNEISYHKSKITGLENKIDNLKKKEVLLKSIAGIVDPVITVPLTASEMLEPEVISEVECTDELENAVESIQ